MLIDSLTLADNSSVSRRVMDPTKRGSAFPGSPSDGDTWELTASYLGHGVGIYSYVTAESVWVVQYPNNDVMPYDVAGATFGAMNNGDVISRHISVRTYRIKTGFEGCISAALIASVADSYIDIIRIDRSGSENIIGKLFFEVAQTVGVFQQIGSGDMTFTAGEHLVLRAPNPADLVLSDIAFTFAGTLV
jgi:hypothetical protein